MKQYRVKLTLFLLALGMGLFCIFTFSNPGLVEAAQNSSLHAAYVPNDPDYPQQRYLNRIRAPQAWDTVQLNTLKKEIIVAVLDTGVYIDHPDLKENIWTNPGEVPNDGIDNDNNSYIDDIHGWDFIESVPDPLPKIKGEYSFEAVHHGTVVAGVVSGVLNNGVGISGISMNAKIMPLRILDSSGAGSTLLLAQAINYAVENGADIINLSLVGEERDLVLEEAITDAYRKGVAIVAASGNTEAGGVYLNNNPRYPICDANELNQVLGVAAVDEFNRVASFSNYGSNCIDLSAPGTGIYSTMWHQDNHAAFGPYYSGGWTGTSVAAPMVSSALALIKRVAPNLSVEEMYRAIITSARSLQQDNNNYFDLGAGLLDIEGALEKALLLSRGLPLRIVTAPGPGYEPRVIVQNSTGSIVSEFLAYDATFKGGLSLAIGDVDGDGNEEIITAPLAGGGPHVKIFDAQGNLKGQFLAYTPQFTGGVNVSVGDITGDGISEIMTSPGIGGGPHIRIFNANGEVLNQFMAYDPAFNGGVSIAVGDMDLDSIDDIITVPMSKGGPHVRVFNNEGLVKGQFMAFDPDFRGGLTMGIGDVDGQRGSELVVARLTDTDIEVKIFDEIAREKTRFFVFPNPKEREQKIRLFVKDYTGDTRDDILIYPANPSADLMLFDYFGSKIDTIPIVDNTKSLTIDILR